MLQVEPTIFERFSVDHLMLPKCQGFNYVLVIIDSFSLWCILLPAKTTGAEETAQLLYHNLFMVYGARTILSDRGAAFRSTLVRELCKLLNVRNVYTSSRHPQTNSRAESFNKTLLNSLRTRCETEKNWPDLLSTIAFVHRTSVVKSIGYSPYRVVFGFDPYLALDDALLPSRNLPRNVQCYFSQMEPQLKILREAVRCNQLAANEKTVATHDAKYNTKVPAFSVADRVLLLEPERSKVKLGHKIGKKFRGPFLILEAYPEFHVYKLQDCETKKVLPSMIHANRIRAFHSDRDRFFAKNAETADPSLSVTAHSTVIDEPRQHGVGVSPSAVDLPGSLLQQSQQQQQQQQPCLPASAAADTQSLQSPQPELQQQTSDGLASTSDVAADNMQEKVNDSESDWHIIKDILAHRRRKRKIFYKVQWLDDTTSWLPQCDVTDFAIDKYFLQRNARRPARRRGRVYSRSSSRVS